MTKVAVIGLGAWGRILFEQLDELFDVVACCNKRNPDNQDWVRSRYPHVRCTTDINSVIGDPDIEAVVIATPISTHARIVAMALEHGKHVFVEKPLTDNFAEAQRLVELASSRDLVLFPGHVFLYDTAVQHLVSILAKDPPLQIDMRWEKYGTFRESIEWNLLCHDISTALALFEASPIAGSEMPVARVIRRERDIVDAELTFSRNLNCRVTIDRCMPKAHKHFRVITEQSRVYVWYPGVLYESTRDERTKLHESPVSAVSLELQTFLSDVKLGTFDAKRTGHGLRVVSTVASIINATAERDTL